MKHGLSLLSPFSRNAQQTSVNTALRCSGFTNLSFLPYFFPINLYHICCLNLFTVGFVAPSVVSGQGLGASDASAEIQRIHQENVDRLGAMDTSAILKERQELLETLGKL